MAVDFRDEGADAWQELTAEAACQPPGDPARRVAIILDDAVITSPQVAVEVPVEAGSPGDAFAMSGAS